MFNLEETAPSYVGTIIHKYADNSIRVREVETDKEYTSLDPSRYKVGDDVHFILEARKVGPVVVVLHKTGIGDDKKLDMSGWI